MRRLLRSDTSGLGQVIDNRKMSSTAAQRPQLHHARRPRARRRPAAGLVAAAHQRRAAADQRVSVRRHLRPAARAGQVAFFPNIDAIQEFKIESNSPPAEFGRFNGGVVNLTTKAGSERACTAALFEFFRHEALNARNFFASDQPGQAAVPAQSVRRRRSVGPIRQRPDVLLRRLSGAATDDRAHGNLHGADGSAASGRSSPRRSAGACRRSTIRPRRSPAGGGVTRSPFPGNTIPLERIDPVARALLERYPLPTSAGTANNYRRVGERDASIRTSSACASTTASRANGDQRLRPLDAIPGEVRSRSRHCRTAAALDHRDTLGPTETPRRGRLPRAISARSRSTLLNELRIRRHPAHPSHRTAATLERHGVGASGPAGYSVNRAVPEHAADLSHRRLSAARIAAEHGDRLRHQRDAGRRLRSPG